MSKRIAMLQALIFMASTMMASGVVSGQDSETVIDTSVAWESDEVYRCSDDIRVADGWVLTIIDSFVDLY